MVICQNLKISFSIKEKKNISEKLEKMTALDPYISIYFGDWIHNIDIVRWPNTISKLFWKTRTVKENVSHNDL